MVTEIAVTHKDRFVNCALSQMPKANNHRIILVKRGIDTLIPSGSTVIKAGDILVTAEFQAQRKEP